MTDTQDLPYPERDDFGNGALQLQALAEAVNAKLVTSNAAYDVLLSPEMVVASASADITGLPVTTVNTLLFSPLYQPDPNTFAITPFFFLGMRPGTYQAGCYIRSIPGGAVTNNTYRTVQMDLVDYLIPGSGSSRYTEEWFNEIWETNTGFEYQTLHIAFSVHSPDQAILNLSFFHGNSGSALTVKADSYFWVARVGDLGI
jgi:hypothetical protein